MRTGIFIDGSNFHETIKTLGIPVDYARIRDLFPEVHSAMYFTALLPKEIHSGLRPLVDWLQDHGWQVIHKEAKRYVDDSGREKIKGNMDIELALNVYDLVKEKAIEHVALFTGDGDFRYLVERVQQLGAYVTVFSSDDMVSRDLKRQAQRYVDIDTLRSDIIRRDEPMVRRRITMGWSA